MTSDTLPPRGRAGFTLIEVLVAMVILAVGLLALEALGIGAARMVNRARLQSSWAAVATDTLERTLSRLRQGQALKGKTAHAVAGDSVYLRVDTTEIGDSGMNRYDVKVTVVPKTRKLISKSDSLRVVGSVLAP
ncbi:MAG TPA: prepilin-type N-terminal cleavage/methylation domain-containing protein [Longimicrobiaceae bacterium]|nr:prepilin-type N-terminal cleavage/methylation domain-containing protein [Longimicrobiaceae bacterium]